MNGLRLEDFFSDPSMNSFKFGDPIPMPPPPPPPPFLNQNGHRYVSAQNSNFSSTSSGSAASAVSGQNRSSSSSASASGGGVTVNSTDSPEDSDVLSDIVLSYISKMLMEEDVDEKVNLLYQEKSAAEAIRAAEKPFYDILAEKNPPPLPPVESPALDESSGQYGVSYAGSSSGSSSNSSGWVSYDPQVYPVSVENSIAAAAAARVPDLFVESHPAWQFRKGVEEARKFLPSGDKLVIDLEASDGFSSVHRDEPPPPREGRNDRFVEVKVEKEERRDYPFVHQGSRGRKNPNRDDLDLAEGRSIKQSALSATSEETVRSQMFDMVLLCQKDRNGAVGVAALREAKQNEVSKISQNGNPKGPNGKARGKKQSKKEVVDLRTLLIQCSQAVAADDRRSASELLKQIRQYSSPFGDGSQRLAHCFADGLEARLAGTGSQIYQSLVAKRTTATDILKAYQLYLAACPFKRISHFFSNQTILDVAANAPRLHIIDFGIYFGFQWPCLIQRLSSRAEGPPKLRITGVDVPQPGFRPTERIEETGKRLADYARSFGVPFEYNAIASKWEAIRVEDLKTDRDEVVVVNCLYRFRNLVDETVVMDSPRNMVLDTIRKADPDVFIHGIVNGSYSAPFFVTRFREALFHFSALFDMLETNVTREDAQRLLIERDLFGREALNVISCEGSERVERPETYKRWQVRNLRAGFTQLPLNPEIMKKARDKVKGTYHKDFVIDEDSRWLLQGWKGRIIYAISTWKPNRELDVHAC